MTNKTLNLMARIESRLLKVEEKAQTHCGFDDAYEDYQRAHWRLLMFIEREIEKLQGGAK